MSAEQRLLQKISELEEQWNLVHQKLSRLEQASIKEDNEETKFKLDNKITDLKAKEKQIEDDLEKHESQLKQPGISQSDKVFLRVCVCRVFKLSGLEHILNIFPTSIFARFG